MRRWASELGPPLLGVAALLLVWAVVAAATDTSSIPGPPEVWFALRHGFTDGSIPEGTVKSLIRLAFSFVAALVIGTALGLVLAAFELARRSIRPLVVALQITPFVAWVPLAVIWFGVTERAVVFVAIAGSFPAVTLATSLPCTCGRGERSARPDGSSSARWCSPQRSPPTWPGSSRRGASHGRR